jgi:hypothetical protein
MSTTTKGTALITGASVGRAKAGETRSVASVRATMPRGVRAIGAARRSDEIGVDMRERIPREIADPHGRAGTSLAQATDIAPLRRYPHMRTVALVVSLFVILGTAIWWAVAFWMSVEGPPMPLAGYVAMWLGIVFSLVIGCGLMALMFFSSRRGYDDAAQGEVIKDS